MSDYLQRVTLGSNHFEEANATWTGGNRPDEFQEHRSDLFQGADRLPSTCIEMQITGQSLKEIMTATPLTKVELPNHFRGDCIAYPEIPEPLLMQPS